MPIIRPNEIKPRPRPAEPRPSLLTAEGRNVGLSIEWTIGGGGDTLSEREVSLIREACRVKRVNIPRCLHIKQCLVTMRPADVVKRFRGRRGYSERFVYGVHAALSKARGERAR